MRPVLVILALHLSGCLTPLQRDQLMRRDRQIVDTSDIRFETSRYVVSRCKLLRPVRGYWTRQDLARRARSIGANTLVIQKWGRDRRGDRLYKASAYWCAPKPARSTKPTVARPSPSRKKRSAEPLRVALAPTAFDGAARTRVPSKTFDEAVMTAITKAGSFDVLGQSDIESLISLEQQKDLLGCDDVSCFAEIGGALGVPLMVSFRVARLKDEWTVTSKCIDIRNTRVVRRSTDFVSGDTGELLRAVPQLVVSLLRRGESTQASVSTASAAEVPSPAETTSDPEPDEVGSDARPPQPVRGAPTSVSTGNGLERQPIRAAKE